MAGVIGTVTNKSAFASFVVRNWEQWMTEAVILHASGVSIPELRVRFSKTDAHLRNIMNTEQAAEINAKISRQAISHASVSVGEKLQAARLMAVDNLMDGLSNTELKEKSPFAFWEASRKTLETVQRMDVPAQGPSTVVTNNILNVSPELLNKLRDTPTMLGIPETTHHVDYIGPPPPAGRDSEELLGRGIRSVEDQGQDGPSIPLSGRPTSG